MAQNTFWHLGGKFLLFAWEQYYPEGGWNDFKGFFNSWQDASSYYEKLKNNDRNLKFYDIINIDDEKYKAEFNFAIKQKITEEHRDFNIFEE